MKIWSDLFHVLESSSSGIYPRKRTQPGGWKMRKSIAAMVLGFAIIAAPNLGIADCDQCLAIVRNAGEASKPMVDRLMQCAQKQSRECQVAVSKALFQKFRIIVDFFPRR